MQIKTLAKPDFLVAQRLPSLIYNPGGATDCTLQAQGLLNMARDFYTHRLINGLPKLRTARELEQYQHPQVTDSHISYLYTDFVCQLKI